MSRGQTLGAMVFNKPQLIALDALQPIINYLSAPDRATTIQLKDVVNQENTELQLSDFKGEDDFRRYKLGLKGINPDTMVGTLDVSGSLMYRKGSMGADCTELTSYEGLKSQTQDMINEGVKTIVMMVDSSGGMAYGMFSAANFIKKQAQQAGVKTVAYVDGVSYSAAYGLSVLADEVIANPQASVGSVGVVVALYNDNKMLENAGVTRQFVFAGENKIPFDNKTGEFTEQFISELQKSVNKTYNSFTRHISTMRGLNEQAIIDTQASTYDADEALELGLIDKIMELEDFELEYGLKVKNKTQASNIYELSGDNQSTREGNMPDTKVVEKKAEGLLPDAKTQPTVGTESMSLVDSLQMQLDNVKKENLELNTQKSNLSKDLKEAQEKYQELAKEKQDLELATRMSERKAKLESALGKDNDGIEAMLANTEALSDEQFEGVAAMFAGTQEATQKNLEEQGGEGDDAQVQLTLSEQLAERAKKMNARKA